MNSEGIDLADIQSSGEFTVRFRSLDKDIDSLAREINEFCPDAVDQGFDALADAASEGRRLPADMQWLIEGLDTNDFLIT